MPASADFQPHEMQLTIRFIQGYRYLDRCGEALVKLENVLMEGWIPTQPSPQGGSLKNDQIGMTATFNAEAMTVHQSEFISFEHFLDQTCKVFDTLWQTFEIKRINAPAMRVVLQKGFKEDEIDVASRYLLTLNLCTLRADIGKLIGGEVSALDLVLVTTEDLVWDEEQVQRRRRMQTSVIRQEKQMPFDTRLLSRARLLPERQREAINALLRLKRQHPEIAPVAAQVDLEYSFESEFSADGFDLPTFLGEAWQWAETVRNEVPRFEKGKA